ncbi:unnamed protein product [Musa acuminata subsp. burmannicoides]
MKREDARNGSPSRPWPLTRAPCLPLQPITSFDSPGEETAAGEDAGDDDDRLLLWEQTGQELLSLENEMVFNEAIIEEREKDIKEIHYDVQQIHEIYQDLAVLLHDQPIRQITSISVSKSQQHRQAELKNNCTRLPNAEDLGLLGCAGC